MHQQTIFYAEYLQTDWLALDLQQTVTWLAMRLPAMIIGGCVGLLVFLLVQGMSDYVSLLQIGLLGGFIGDSFSQQVVAGPLRVTCHRSHEKRVYICHALLLGVLLAASFGLSFAFGSPSVPGVSYSLSDWGRDGSLLGLGGGLSFWIFQRLLHRMGGKPGRETSARPSRQRGLAAWLTRTTNPSVWQATTALGVGMGLSYGLNSGLSYGLNSGLNSGLGYGLSVGLIVGIIVVLVHVILADSMGSLRFAERIHWTWRDLLRSQHLRISGSIAGALFLFFGLSYGLSSGLIVGLNEGLSQGLNEGLIIGLIIGLIEGLIEGLSHGLSHGLIFWLLLGLYQGMKQEHLEDQDRQRFNQGIRRSLRNGLLLGLISAIIISMLGLLSVGLSYGLSHGLRVGLNYGLSVELSHGPSVGLSYGLNNVWIMLLIGTVVMWALSGGLTILRHYVIRWLLARHHTFPFRAQAFLDDATARILLRRVGGGYSFIHRRLQDYFAEVVVPPSRK